MKHIQVYIFLLVTISRNISLAKSHDARIINGTQDAVSKAKYYALITSCDLFFGGTILSRNRVITAARYVYKCRPSKTRVTVGLNKRSDIYATKYDVNQIKIHPKYNHSNPTPYNVAILYISNNIEFTTQVGRINISPYIPPDGSLVQIYGYGYTNLKAQTMSRRLQTTKMEVFGLLTSTVILSKALNTTAYSGDFGGPAVYKGELVGVISDIVYLDTKILLNQLVACASSEINKFIKNNR